jgi:hypothetical protein
MSRALLAACCVLPFVRTPLLADNLPVPAGKACFDFEAPLALGTKYVVRNSVGNKNYIDASIEDFTNSGGTTTSGFAYIDSAALLTGNGQNIRTNNVNLLLDFSNIGFAVGEVEFAFLDMGGNENLAVDGGPRYVNDISSAPPSNLGNVSVKVYSAPVPGGHAGTVRLGGFLKTLSVGGQEFWIDTVCVSLK